ncbi:hypothetical protein R0H03_10210 [Pediococcus acidilactici]|uniref:Uncharacterized protein n=1 Tax=Pediococcus acidilactici TaxID=1254 RepID=A0AAW8YP24_PEDAC|nr:hypothetical protein [Pediococcus acidilactici]MDV2912203.1 hypothetical protein [Pediococcus acidilactici]WQS18335.1 hypothetical protein SGW14_04685 [Pediococcus acidilactici]
MNRLKKIVKTIWEYKWVILISFAIFSSIVSTIQGFISKDYESGFNNLMIFLLFIEMILLLWSRAEAEKLIDIQNEVIDSQDKLIKQNEKSIELRDEIIAKKSKWIEEVKKIIEENSRKMED